MRKKFGGYLLLLMAGMLALAYALLHPLHMQWETLEQQNTQLQLKLEAARQAASLAVAQPVPLRLQSTWEQLLQLVRDNQLQLSGATAIPTEAKQYHLSLAGDFAHLHSFFAVLQRDHYPVSVQDIALQQDKQNHLRATIDIIILQGRMPAIINFQPVLAKHDPFCDVPTQSTATPAVAIKQMRIGGVLQQSRERLALLTMPDQTAMHIKIGDIIGAEHAQVIAINAGDITLQLPNHKLTHIKQ